MKKSNLFILAIAAPMLLAGITSCGNSTHKMKHGEFAESPKNLRYLYEVTYDDYSWDDVTKWMNSQKNVNSIQGGFGCSSVHNGNYYGRSFDFCFTTMCEFLVHTPHTSSRFASMGISIANCGLDKEKVENINKGTDDEDLKLHEKMIPFAMVDGINENGVVCNTNVVPAKDLTPHEGEEKYHTHGTNPGKPKLFYQFMPRFILDNAKSAKHAVELLKNRNLSAINGKGALCDYLGVSHMGYELHCMVADKNDTFIIEMVDDEMNIVKSGANVMTNYYLTNTTPSGAGLERYGILFDGYKDVDSIEKMEALINKVQYGPSYNPEWNGNDTICPMWPTEFSGSTTPTLEAITFYNATDWCTKHWKDGEVNMSEKLKTPWETVKDTKDNDKRAPAVGATVPWISTHAEAYDIENKTLHLTTQEDYEWKEFKL